jgi:hypothetical protein
VSQIVVDFLFFWKCLKEKKTFLDQNIFFFTTLYNVGYHAFFYSIVWFCILFRLQKEVPLWYTPVGVLWKKCQSLKPWKLSLDLVFFNLCVTSPLVLTTRFVIEYLQKPLIICINNNPATSGFIIATELYQVKLTPGHFGTNLNSQISTYSNRALVM